MVSDDSCRRFIETPFFPVDDVNSASAKEKQGGGRPPHWEMVFWWTRKPLASARAVVAGALLPADTDPARFRENLRLARGVAHRLSPHVPPEWGERFGRARLLDPFAGFGSIPLEALRLGVGEVVAVELLPTAYVFLKAVLEYPKELSSARVRVSGREVEQLGLESAVRMLTGARRVVAEEVYEIPRLVYDVAKWGRWVVERLREDPDIGELYDEDAAVYIGTWEVRCPNTLCNRYTPLVGNWWLARVGGRKRVFMKPAVDRDSGRVVIEVAEGGDEKPPQPNVRGRPETAWCLVCGSRITYIDPETGTAYATRNDAPAQVRKRLEFYPKYALRDWNRRLEEYLEGRIELDELRNALARPRLLVKARIVGRDLVFEPCSEEDNEKLWRALEKLRQLWRDPDIPTEPIPEYESRNIWVYPYGFNKWFKLFNPRQLLTLVKLVKLIREASRRVEEERLQEGWNREEARKYAEAVATYLAIALCKYVDYSSLIAGWNQSLIMAHSFSMRALAVMWNWYESLPWASRTGSYSRNIIINVNALSYLISAVNGSRGKVRVLLDDATRLSKLGNEEFDVVVTDPPYRDDFPYAELSDFYYVWLRRALSDVENGKLRPRFHPEALAYSTQWRAFATSEISLNKGRARYFGLRCPDGYRSYYGWLLSRAFRKMSSVVKDDGVVVTYFAHSSPEAWIELIEAGWRRAGLMVTGVYGIATESVQRVTARGKVALESSIVVVWRKRREGKEASVDRVRKEALARAVEALERAERLGLRGLDLFLAVMAACLSVFTSYDRITRFAGELSSEDVVRESYRIAVEALVGGEVSVKSPEALAYIVIRRLFSRVEGWDWTLDSQDLITLGYGLYGGGGEAQVKKLYQVLVENRIVKPTSRRGARVAQAERFTFLSPRDASIDSIKEVLSHRSLDAIELKVLTEKGAKPLTTSIDVLHLLEYAVHQGSEYFRETYSRLMLKYPTLTDEAISVARALTRISDDPEASLCSRILRNIAGWPR